MLISSGNLYHFNRAAILLCAIQLVINPRVITVAVDTFTWNCRVLTTQPTLRNEYMYEVVLF